MRTKSLATDPEALAKIPPPTIRTIYDGPASDASWSQVSDAESRGKGSGSKTMRSQPNEGYKMSNLLRSRLEMLEHRQKSRPVHMVED